jgi:hypothetical protein
MKHGEVARMFEPDWMACSGGGELGRLDGDFIVLTAKGDLDHLRKLVPAPLEATDEVIIYTSRFKETIDDEGNMRWPWAFNEWGFGVRAKLTEPPYAEGNFLIQLYVDDDLVLVHGREVWGYPKKIGQTEISDTSVESSSYDYTVSRRGSQLVTGGVSNLEPCSVEEFPFAGEAFNICYRQVPADTLMKGDGEITIQDGPYDQMPFGELTDIKGYFGRVSMYHHGVCPLVVDATERARPIDYSRVGPAFQTV